MILKNEKTGAEIVLEETDDIDKLRNQLLLLDMNGLTYTKIWNKIADKIYEKEPKNCANCGGKVIQNPNMEESIDKNLQFCSTKCYMLFCGLRIGALDEIDD